MFRHIDMHDASTLVSQHDEHKEYPEGHRGHGEDITRHDIFNVVVQKRLPRR